MSFNHAALGLPIWYLDLGFPIWYLVVVLPKWYLRYFRHIRRHAAASCLYVSCQISDKCRYASSNACL